MLLQEELDRKLAERQARETGICPVREHLYQQLFGKRTTSPRSMELQANLI